MGPPIVHILWPYDSTDCFVLKTGEILTIQFVVQSATDPDICWSKSGEKLTSIKTFCKGNGRYESTFFALKNDWNYLDLIVTNRDGVKCITVPIKIFNVHLKATNNNGNVIKRSETFRSRDLTVSIVKSQRFRRSAADNSFSICHSDDELDVDDTIDSTMSQFSNVSLGGTLKRYPKFKNNDISPIRNERGVEEQSIYRHKRLSTSAPKLNRRTKSAAVESSQPMFSTPKLHERNAKSCMFSSPKIRREVRSISNIYNDLPNDDTCEVMDISPLAIDDVESSSFQFKTIAKSPTRIYKSADTGLEKKDETLPSFFDFKPKPNRFEDTAKTLNSNNCQTPIIMKREKTADKNNNKSNNVLWKRFSKVFSFRSKKDLQLKNSKKAPKEIIQVMQPIETKKTESNEVCNYSAKIPPDIINPETTSPATIVTEEVICQFFPPRKESFMSDLNSINNEEVFNIEKEIKLLEVKEKKNTFVMENNISARPELKLNGICIENCENEHRNGGLTVEKPALVGNIDEFFQSTSTSDSCLHSPNSSTEMNVIIACEK